MSPAPLASGDKDDRVAPDNLTGAFVSPLLEQQGPKSSTVSARISLPEVTPTNTGSLTALGSLERGWHPSNGTATRRSSGPLDSLRRLLLARFEKEAEVALRPQERPVRTLSALSVSLVKRNRGTGFSLSALWARQSRSAYRHPGVLRRMSFLRDGRGTAGSRDGFAVIRQQG
jgi:hypothetical protein